MDFLSALSFKIYVWIKTSWVISHQLNILGSARPLSPLLIFLTTKWRLIKRCSISSSRSSASILEEILLLRISTTIGELLLANFHSSCTSIRGLSTLNKGCKLRPGSKKAKKDLELPEKRYLPLASKENFSPKSKLWKILMFTARKKYLSLKTISLNSRRKSKKPDHTCDNLATKTKYFSIRAEWLNSCRR